MILTSWQDILRLTVTGVLAYGGLIAVLRLSGKRTLSKLSAFDFVVTVALGSSLATILLSKSTPCWKASPGSRFWWGFSSRFPGSRPVGGR